MCSRWKNSFDSFLEDMGIRPEGLTLERINNDNGYWCGKCGECLKNNWESNCTWVTRVEQSANRRESKKYRLAKVIEHGTLTKYNYGCRCDHCRKKNTDSNREYRHKHRKIHNNLLRSTGT